MTYGSLSLCQDWTITFMFLRTIFLQGLIFEEMFVLYWCGKECLGQQSQRRWSWSSFATFFLFFYTAEWFCSSILYSATTCYFGVTLKLHFNVMRIKTCLVYLAPYYTTIKLATALQVRGSFMISDLFCVHGESHGNLSASWRVGPSKCLWLRKIWLHDLNLPHESATLKVLYHFSKQLIGAFLVSSSCLCLALTRTDKRPKTAI